MTDTVGSVHNLFPYLEEPDKFPRLPVPDLKLSLDRYLRAVRAITTDEEYNQTVQRVQQFALSPESARLHAKLHQLAEQSPTSWLEGLWDTMYLELRCPVMVHVSPYYAIADDPQRTSDVARCAAFIESTTRFHDALAQGRLTPDPGLDMSQYGKVLGSCRIPRTGRDTYAECKDGNYVVLVCKNQFYKIVCRDSSGAPIREEDLLPQVMAVVEDAQRTDASTVVPVGIFTADDRDAWAAGRAELLKLPENRASLQIIEDALIVFCLDDREHHNLTDVSEMLLHGGGRNRWFDKSVQIMIGKNGKAGALMEHTRFDGHSIIKLIEFIWKDSTARPTTPVTPSPAPLEKLRWNFSPAFLKLLEGAIGRVDELIASVDTHVLEFNDWGKGLIKTFRMSPDAFVQMAYQLAYYRYRKTHGSTYESCNMKRFYHGRTTCIRSCTLEANAFTEIFENSQATKEQKIEALKVAVNRHVEISMEARDGNDFDRPLFGWYHMARFEQQKFPNREIPSLYADPIYARLKTDMLSTSNSSGSSTLTMFGFGPTSGNGFGLGYVIDEDYINVDVTSFTGEASNFVAVLKQSLLDMAALFQ